MRGENPSLVAWVSAPWQVVHGRARSSIVSATRTGPCNRAGATAAASVFASGWGRALVTKCASAANMPTSSSATSAAAPIRIAGWVPSRSRAASLRRRTPKIDHNTVRSTRRNRMPPYRISASSRLAGEPGAIRFQCEIEERDTLREDGAEIAAGIRRGQAEPGVGLAGLKDDVHPLPASEVQHGLVLAQAMHEKALAPPVAGVQRGALEKRVAVAAVATARQHRHAELRVVFRAREVRGRDQAKLVVGDAEHRVAVEIDCCDIRADDSIARPAAKAQPPVLGVERDKVALVRRAVERRQLTDGPDRQCGCTARRNASMSTPTTRSTRSASSRCAAWRRRAGRARDFDACCQNLVLSMTDSFQGGLEQPEQFLGTGAMCCDFERP